VASAVDVVVHMARLRDGRRVVFEIATVDGLDDRDEPMVTEVYAFRPRVERDGAFVVTGAVPPLRKILTGRGQDIAEGLFSPGIDA
jgi:hypothetical protein